MQLLLVCGVLSIILQSTWTGDPGDPFPTDVHKTKPITSEDIINTDEVVEPNDHEIPLPSETLTNLNDPNDDRENVIFTTTEINKNDDDHDDVREKLLSVESVNPKNLIKIGRWKYVDLETKQTRYWYETEGGHMGTGWAFDGFIFQAYNKSEPGTEPVYAFHSELRSLWTNTIQMNPKAPLLGNDQWISDGIAFYTYRTPITSNELQPVVRYWNKLEEESVDASAIRVSYLLMKEKNDDYDLENDRLGWTLDKILFYALPIEN